MMKRSMVLMLVASAFTLAACGKGGPMTAAIAPAMNRPVQATSTAGIKNGFRYMAERIMQTCDKSKDEFLQPEEAALAGISPDLFAKYDLDHDGKLSLKELVVPSLKKEQIASFRQMALRNFGSLDVSPNDGILSVVEFLAHAEGRPQEWERAMFNMNDKNRDRKMSLSEYEDFFAWYCAADLETYLPKPDPTPTATPSAIPGPTIY